MLLQILPGRLQLFLCCYIWGCIYRIVRLVNESSSSIITKNLHYLKEESRHSPSIAFRPKADLPERPKSRALFHIEAIE